MTVNAITDTKKGRTGIAPTYLHTTHLLLTILVVTSILIVHFGICILPKYIFDGSWGKWRRGSFR